MSLVTMMALGASAQKKERVTVKQVVVEMKDESVLIQKDGTPYTGSFWSEDAKSIMFKAENGKVVREIVYYPSMKICYMNENGKVTYYNREGERVYSLSSSDAQYLKTVRKEQGIQNQ